MKRCLLLSFQIAVLLSPVAVVRAALPDARYVFLMATRDNQYFNFNDVEGTHTLNYSNPFGSGSCRGTMSGGSDPTINVQASLNTIYEGQYTDVLVELHYYFQVDGPAGNVTMNFVGNLDYPNPLPAYEGTGTRVESRVAVVGNSVATDLAFVSNNPMTVNLPASGVPGHNLNQTFVASANVTYEVILAAQVHPIAQTATYEITLDPVITIEAGFAATHPGYALSFSPGFAPAPVLQIQTVGTNAVLSWPTSATGYVLQNSTNLATNSWTTITNIPSVVGSFNTVTNPLAPTAGFYRLKN